MQPYTLLYLSPVIHISNLHANARQETCTTCQCTNEAEEQSVEDPSVCCGEYLVPSAVAVATPSLSSVPCTSLSPHVPFFQTLMVGSWAEMLASSKCVGECV